MKNLLSTIALVLVTLSASPAEAATVDTFAGSCILRGTDTFTPALTLKPMATTVVADVTGNCNGTLRRSDGSATKLTAASARLVLQTTSPSLSCTGGSIRGTATLSVHGTSVVMKLNEPQLTAVSVLFLTGTTTGTAQGFAYADQRTNYIGSVQECLGAGVGTIPITVSILAATPIG